MCTVSKKATREDGSGLPGGSAPGMGTCAHRRKKGLFKGKEVAKFLKKSRGNQCEECSRSDTPSTTNNGEVFVCATCAKCLCSHHATLHSTTSRNGDNHVIMIVIKDNKYTVKCLDCNEELSPQSGSGNKDCVHEILNIIGSSAKLGDRQGHGKNKGKGNGAGGKVPVVPDEDIQPTNKKSMPHHKGKVPRSIPNRGNTCYFNSVCQSIIATHAMQLYFTNLCKTTHLKIKDGHKVTVDEKKITLNGDKDIVVHFDKTPMNDTLQHIIQNTQQSTSAIEPGPLLSILMQKGRVNKGAQQDAHELLRYLLDGIRTEEMEVYKRGIIHHFGATENLEKKKDNDDFRLQLKGYLEAAGRPHLDAVFGGRLIQFIKCHKCGTVCEQNESFLDLSLPVPSTSHPKIVYKPNKKGKNKYSRNEYGMEGECDGNEDISNGMNNLSVDDEAGETTGPLVECPVEYSTPSSSGLHIHHLMYLFMAKEELLGDNRYECENCCVGHNKKKQNQILPRSEVYSIETLGLKGSAKKRCDAWKRYLIVEPPVVLTLHIKRFSQTSGGRGGLHKLGVHVAFPEELDIAPFCCQKVERIRDDQSSIRYSLYAVVSHSGTMHGGHYIAYVKTRSEVPNMKDFYKNALTKCAYGINSDDKTTTLPDDKLPAVMDSVSGPEGQWYFCSDTTINPVPVQRVLSAEAYILFYERIQ